MDQLFGVSMDSIMWVLLALLAVSLVSVAFIFFNNRVMFMMGVRNLGRRRLQSALVIVGPSSVGPLATVPNLRFHLDG